MKSELSYILDFGYLIHAYSNISSLRRKDKIKVLIEQLTFSLFISMAMPYG